MQNPAASPAPGRLRPPLLRLLKIWIWIIDHLHPTELQGTLIWAGIIGFFSAVASLLFRTLTAALHGLLTGQANPGMVESFAHLSLWARLLTPAAGGVLAGLILFFGLRWRGAVDTTDYMEAIVLGDGRISARLSIVKCLSAMFTIATGGSIGREGPLVQLSSLVASAAGRIRNWSTPRLRLMVGCGAAAGIASAYNAPIAGALFVAEIVLGTLAMEIFGPLVFSSVIATLTIRGFLGSDPLYDIPPFRLYSNWEIIPYLFLGLFTGFIAPWFLRFLQVSERLFARVPGPTYVKMGIGGLIVGALAVVYPEVCGNGYTAVNAILRGDWLWQSLALILLFKTIATSATFGSGAVGGVFTPTLFIGASLGYLFACALRLMPLPFPLNPSAFALVGMGAFLAGTTHAPIMAIIILFELTLDYEIIAPLMLACVIAYYTAFSIEKRSIYSESLKRKGAGGFRAQLAELQVRDLMKTDPVSVLPTARFAEIGQKFIAHRFNYLYVIDPARHFIGAISLHDVKNYLNEPDLAELIIARDIMRDEFPHVAAGASLTEALDAFTRHDGERLPVINNGGEQQLTGSISKTDLILALAGRSSPDAAAAPV